MQTTTNSQTSAPESSKADRGGRQTGYVCKKCEGAAPVGVGYAIYGWSGVADESRTSCDCGYSRKAGVTPAPFTLDDLCAIDEALSNLIQDKADYCPNEEGTAEHIERLQALRAKVATYINAI